MTAAVEDQVDGAVPDLAQLEQELQAAVAREAKQSADLAQALERGDDLNASALETGLRLRLTPQREALQAAVAAERARLEAEARAARERVEREAKQSRLAAASPVAQRAVDGIVPTVKARAAAVLEVIAGLRSDWAAVVKACDEERAAGRALGVEVGDRLSNVVPPRSVDLPLSAAVASIVVSGGQSDAVIAQCLVELARSQGSGRR